MSTIVSSRSPMAVTRIVRAMAVALLFSLFTSPAVADSSRELLWGDTHLHTAYSFDAFLNGNRSADPDTAYRWAKGLPVIHPYHRARVRVKDPLDFLVVADHAEFLGVIRKLYYDIHDGPGAEFAQQVRDVFDSGQGGKMFAGVLPMGAVAPGDTEDPISEAGAPNLLAVGEIADGLRRDTWAYTSASADLHEEPGHFSTMMGLGLSSRPAGANLRRVVRTPADV